MASTLTLLTLLLFIMGCLQEVPAQGMVPLSEVIDHKVDKNQADKSRGNNKFSEQKLKAHMNIASSHLAAERESSTSKEFEKTNRQNSDKVSRKDKPEEFQNPAKHMAEEFVLNFLMKQYPNSESVEEKVEILQNLENFAHKFENGRDLFKATTALHNILLPALNSSHVEIRKSACGVFAIAAQNNLDVQDSAANAGVIRHMVHLLTFDQPVRSKALFALTALVRNFPKGQEKFINEGGIPALVKVAVYSETRKRSLNFVADLLEERNYCRLRIQTGELENHDVTNLPTDRSTTSNKFSEDSSSLFEHPAENDNNNRDDDPCDQFKTLEKALKESGWCDVLADSIKNIPGFDTEDQIMTSEAVASSLSFCVETVAPYANIFHHLLGKFEKDEDFVSESAVLKNIIRVIDPLSLQSPKDEL